MKLYLIDGKNALDQNLILKLPKGVDCLKSITDIDNPKGLACLTDEFSAREYFGTTQERPVKFLGERFDEFEYGITLPKFEQTIPDEFSKVKDFFIKTFDIVKHYNDNHANNITALIYQVDQLVLRQNDFVTYFDAFIEAYEGKFGSEVIKLTQ